jgi:hypothetical protein
MIYIHKSEFIYRKKDVIVIQTVIHGGMMCVKIQLACFLDFRDESCSHAELSDQL